VAKSKFPQCSCRELNPGRQAHNLVSD